ncbi:MAG: hypothetical protein Q9208_006852 [Pyrenodesmia sp. 3 TL-2023]
MAVETMEATKPAEPTGEFHGDIDVDNKPPTKRDLDKVAQLPVVDENGKPHTFESLYSSDTNEAPRNCQEYLRSLSTSITPDALQALPTPTKVIVIGCGQPALIPMYTKETQCPFPIYADPSKKLYAQLGMIRTLSLGSRSPEYMQYSLPSAVIRAIYQGLKAGRDAFRGGDYWQVGGEFLFEDGQVSWCHRMKNTRDHAEIPETRRQLGLDGAKPPLRKTFSSGIRRSSSQLQRRFSDRRKSWSRSRDRTEKSSPEGSMMEKVKEDKQEEEASERSSKENAKKNGAATAKKGS